MKKVIILALALVAGSAALSAQDTQKAAAEAAAALTAATDKPEVAPKPSYWTNSILNQINFGQTSLWNWAAGGYNNYTLAAAIDANANYKKDKMIWNNRLQLDYGFLYSADKPILQKTKDRIYFESKWGYETPVRHLSYSANFDFKTQFDDNFKYGTPKNEEGHDPSIQDWLDARTLMSGFLSPAYTNLGIGLLWTPKPWFSLNFSPLTADLVIVRNPALRNTYGMELRGPAEHLRHGAPGREGGQDRRREFPARPVRSRCPAEGGLQVGHQRQLLLHHAARPLLRLSPQAPEPPCELGQQDVLEAREVLRPHPLHEPHLR